MSPRSGMALVAAGAIGFGLMPLFARTAFADGLSPLSLLVWRFAFAVACMLPALPRVLAAPRPLLFAILTGGAYMGSMLFYFMALQDLTVALTVLILFTYPLFTILLGWLAFGARPTWPTALAALLVLLAAGLILGPGGLPPGTSPTAVALAFVPPLAYAVFIHVAAKRLGEIAAPVRLAGVFTGGLATMLLLAFGFEGGVTVPSTLPGWGAVAALGVLSTVGALGLLLIGAPAAGAERSAIAGASELVTALIVGAVAFGEALAPATLAGAGLILLAILLSARQPTQAT